MSTIEIPEREEVSLVFNYGEGLSLDQYLACCAAPTPLCDASGPRKER